MKQIVHFEDFEEATEISMENYYASDLMVFEEDNRYYVSNELIFEEEGRYISEFIYVGKTKKDVIDFFETLNDCEG